MLPYIIMDLAIFVIADGLFCWWISVVSKVVFNLAFLSIFLGLAALMSADIARNL